MRKRKKLIGLALLLLALGGGLFAVWKFIYLPLKYARLTQKTSAGRSSDDGR
jgi:hypothetical protein